MGIFDFFNGRPPVELRDRTREELLAAGARSHGFTFTGTDGVEHLADLLLSDRPASDTDSRLRDDWYDGWLAYTRSDGTPYSGSISVLTSGTQRVGWTEMVGTDAATLEDAILSFAETLGIVGSGWQARLAEVRTPRYGMNG